MAAKKTTGKRTSYGPDIDSLLADYSAIMHRASERDIVRDAIRHFIKHQLSRNKGLEEDFNELRRKRLANERSKLQLVVDPNKD
ncbi:MAG: hypothetical protein WDM89_09155 [Rhizomicrobium sp.]